MSGIDTANLIEQLMQIEARPVNNLNARVQELDVQRAAFLELSAQLLALQNSTVQFDKLSFFNTFRAVSTNENVLTASAGRAAIPGSYKFRVHSLVTNHSVVSRGFADADATPIGTGTVSIEVGKGRVDRSTDLDTLNGGAGVRRGTITITDRRGATAQVNLSLAQTVDDVLEAINTNTTINIRARVTSLSSAEGAGDRLVIEDFNPEDQINGHLVIADEVGGFTAADLGIAANVAQSRVDGGDLVRLSSGTSLRLLNDGNGIGRLLNGPDLIFTRNDGESFTVSLTDMLQLDTGLDVVNHGQGVRGGERIVRITDRSGRSAEVDLTAAVTIRDVRDAIKAADADVGITVVNSRLQLVDESGAAGNAVGNLIVEDVVGYAAADLGIAASVEANDIQGRDIYGVTTVGDVIRAINHAPGNGDLVRAEISEDGDGIRLIALGQFDTITVTAGQDSTAAEDLGLLEATFGNGRPFESRRLLAGLNTVLLRSLNGGAGVGLGAVSFIDGGGRTTTIDFFDAETLQDVIERINADEGTSLVASVSSTGTGIDIRDESGAGQVIIADLAGGSLAADLGIAGAHDLTGGDAVRSGNLQVQYISAQTLLSELNGGRGIDLSNFRITDSTGAAHTVILGSNLQAVGQVIHAINRDSRGAVEARVNDTGDGILVIDQAGGSLAMTIEDVSGHQTAADLRLAGTADSGQNFIDGSYEIRIEVGGGDTLDDLVRKIGQADGRLTAAILNDGGSVNPYCLTITSRESGRGGKLVIDFTGIDFAFETLTKAQDAIITVGDESSHPLLVTSSSNTLDNVVNGLTLNLVSTGDEEVTVTVSQDVDQMVEALTAFVEKYNEIQATIAEATSFDSDTMERGPLLGDSTVDLIRTRLTRVIMRNFGGEDAPISRLFSVGLRLGAGNTLEFDEQDFRGAYRNNPESVEELFTAQDTGVGDVLQNLVDGMTRSYDGLIARKEDLILNQQELLSHRIDQLNILLSKKRARLEAQFVGLETALAALQAQQDSLAALTQLVNRP